MGRWENQIWRKIRTLYVAENSELNAPKRLGRNRRTGLCATVLLCFYPVIYAKPLINSGAFPALGGEGL